VTPEVAERVIGEIERGQFVERQRALGLGDADGEREQEGGGDGERRDEVAA